MESERSQEKSAAEKELGELGIARLSVESDLEALRKQVSEKEKQLVRPSGSKKVDCSLLTFSLATRSSNSSPAGSGPPGSIARIRVALNSARPEHITMFGSVGMREATAAS